MQQCLEMPDKNNKCLTYSIISYSSSIISMIHAYKEYDYYKLAKYPSVGRVSAMVLRCHLYLNTVVTLDHWIILEYV